MFKNESRNRNGPRALHRHGSNATNDNSSNTIATATRFKNHQPRQHATNFFQRHKAPLSQSAADRDISSPRKPSTRTASASNPAFGNHRTDCASPARPLLHPVIFLQAATKDANSIVQNGFCSTGVAVLAGLETPGFGVGEGGPGRVAACKIKQGVLL